MIYRANSTTKQIRLKLNFNKFDDCCDDVQLHITPLVCVEPPKFKYCWTECGSVERIEIKREPLLTLVYDMFNRDENGFACFLLDSQFTQLECGRYVASVVVCGCKETEFQIDKRDKVSVSQVTIDDGNNCCDEQCCY